MWQRTLTHLALEQLESRRMLATFVVDTLADSIDSQDGQTSLREAVDMANDREGEDRIVFADEVTGLLNLNKGVIIVSETVAIEGPGADKLRIDARGNDPTPNLDNADGEPAFAMSFQPFPPYAFLHLSGVTITGADSVALGGIRGSLSHVVIEGNRSGGISVGDLPVPPANEADSWYRITDSIFRNNFGDYRESHSGGAVESYGKLHIERSLFEGNRSGSGGAIRAHDSFVIRDSSFLNNLARDDGGVIYASLSSQLEATAEIYNSTFANNVTDGVHDFDAASGSALALRGLKEVKIIGTTISGNEIRTNPQVAIGSGAIEFQFTDGTMTIERSTIVNNRHTGPLAVLADYGGVAMPGEGTLIISDTVIANNSGEDLLLPDHSKIRHSFIGRTFEPALPPTDGSPDANGNIVGSPFQPLDPQLAALADNGSGVLTHLPLAGSPLIDAGDPQFVADDLRMEFDQRGAPFARVVGGRMDIGSVEYSLSEPNPLIFFEQELACCTVNQPSTVDSGDVDGDGDRDLVVGSFQDGSIVWYENRAPDRGFGGQRIITNTSDFVQHIRLLDLDGDGDLDVLAASYGTRPVAWYENKNGQGDFNPAKLISNEGAYRVAAGDIDGDGDLDVSTLSATSGTLSWFRNQGRAGSFAGPLTVASNLQNADSLELADLDRDGDPDFIVGGTNDRVLAWYENEQQGTFTREHTVSAGIFDSYDSIPADMDGDGDLDIVTAIVVEDRGQYFNDLIWMENTNGRGALTTGHTIAAAVSGTEWIHPADVDGDGDTDVVVGLYFEESLVWFENRGGPTNFPRHTISEDVPDSVAGDVVDLDGDGDVEVAVASFLGNRVALFESPGNIRSTWSSTLVTPPTPSILQPADLDGDGDTDLVSAAEEGEIHWYQNQGQEQFRNARVATRWRPGLKFVITADMDQDNDVDLILATQRNVAWVANDGRGVFGDPTNVGRAPDNIRSVEAVDLDQDGDLDLLTTTDSSVVWYENTNGKAEFADATTIVAAQATWSLTTDVDGDGLPDIVVAMDKMFVWYGNEGSGKFSAARIISDGSSYTTGAVADLDGDGDADLVVATETNQFSDVYWYRNDGEVFNERAQVGNTVSVIDRIELADLDSDGHVDVLLAPTGTGQAFWHRGLGSGMFARSLPIPLADNEQFRVVDLDSDGNLDLLMASVGRGWIGWLEQRLPGDSNNDGIFNSSDLVTVFTAGKYEDGIPNNATFAEGDWNQDGDFDTSDLVLAFQAGHYEAAAQPPVAEIAAAVDWLFSHDDDVKRSRAFVA